MSRRFQNRFKHLMERATRIRLAAERELARRRPDNLRILRLRQLQLVLSERLLNLTHEYARRRAYAPRLVPVRHSGRSLVVR